LEYEIVPVVLNLSTSSNESLSDQKTDFINRSSKRYSLDANSQTKNPEKEDLLDLKSRSMKFYDICFDVKNEFLN
jgi:hypothetical protein